MLQEWLLQGTMGYTTLFKSFSKCIGVLQSPFKEAGYVKPRTHLGTSQLIFIRFHGNELWFGIYLDGFAIHFRACFQAQAAYRQELLDTVIPVGVF